MTGDDGGPVVHAVDFGTSTSMLMVGRPGAPPLLVRDPAAALGESGTPSSVCARRDGSLAVGFEAERAKLIRIRDYRSKFKPEIGQPVTHRLGSRDYTPEQLMAEVLRFLRERALALVPAEPDVVVLTVPAAWEAWTRDLAVQACATAGYEPARVRLETEPVAALASLGPAEGTTLVYDFGGGTFDCAVAVDTGSGPKLLGAPFGLPHVGGRQIDERILRHVRQTYPQAANLFSPDDDDDLLRRRIQLRRKCIDAKLELSVRDHHEGLLSELDPQEFLELTRDGLAQLIGDLIQATLDECERLLRALGLSWRDVDRCVLVGGSTRLGLVAQRLESRSGRPVRATEEPELAVVRGAVALALGVVDPPAPQGPPAEPRESPVADLHGEADGEGDDEGDDEVAVEVAVETRDGRWPPWRDPGRNLFDET